MSSGGDGVTSVTRTERPRNSLSERLTRCGMPPVRDVALCPTTRSLADGPHSGPYGLPPTANLWLRSFPRRGVSFSFPLLRGVCRVAHGDD